MEDPFEPQTQPYQNLHGEQPLLLKRRKPPSPWLKAAAIFLEVCCGVSIFVFSGFTFQEIGLGDIALTDNNVFGEALQTTLPDVQGYDLLALLCALTFTGIFIAAWRRTIGDQSSVRNQMAERLITAFYVVAVIIVAASEATFAIAMVEQRAINPLNSAGLENPGIAYFSAVLFILINATAGLMSALSFNGKSEGAYS